MITPACNTPTNQINEKQFLDWTREILNLIDEKKNVITKPALVSLLLQFCLVRTRYIMLRLSSLLFCHCSRTIDPIVPLLFSSQLFGLSVFCVFWQKEKSVGWNTLARIYIFHLYMTQAKLKTMKKETHQLFKKFCCLPCHVFPVSIGAMLIYLFLLCAS